MGTKTAEKTVAEVQGEIAALQQEQKQLQQDISQIEQQIADRWNEDTGELEAAATLKQTRLNASGKVLERLEKDLAAATKAELLEGYRQLCEQHVPNMNKADKALVKVKSLQEQLKQAQDDLRDAQRWDEAARHALNLRIPAGVRPDPANKYEDAGITQSDIDAIRKDVKRKYKQQED